MLANDWLEGVLVLRRAQSSVFHCYQGRSEIGSWGVWAHQSDGAKLWFRKFQIVYESGSTAKKKERKRRKQSSKLETGPRASETSAQDVETLHIIVQKYATFRERNSQKNCIFHRITKKSDSLKNCTFRDL